MGGVKQAGTSHANKMTTPPQVLELTACPGTPRCFRLHNVKGMDFWRSFWTVSCIRSTVHLNHLGYKCFPLSLSSLNNRVPSTIDTTGLWDPLQHKVAGSRVPEQPRACLILSSLELSFKSSLSAQKFTPHFLLESGLPWMQDIFN